MTKKNTIPGLSKSSQNEYAARTRKGNSKPKNEKNCGSKFNARIAQNCLK